MRKLWQRISYNGIDNRGDYSKSKELIILNKLNFFVLLLFLLIFLLLLPNVMVEGIKPHSLRVLLIILSAVINIFLNSRKLFTISKISIVVFIPFLILVFPTIFGDVVDEYFFWYPYAAITFSLLPHFIFNYENEKKFVLISLFFYFILVVTIEHILFLVKSEELLVYPLIEDNFRWIKLIHIFLFSFINIAFYYTLSLLKQFEISLKDANDNLKEHKEELEEKNCELESLIVKLGETQTQLFHSEKMASIGILASGVAHEINNPLNYISGSIQAINNLVEECVDKKKSSEEFKESIANIKSLISNSNNGIEKVAEIVNSLMTFSFRGESQFIPTDLNKIIESTILITRSRIPEQIEIIKNLSELPTILARQDEIHQLIFNIIDNAVTAIRINSDLKKEKIIISTQANSSSSKGFVTLKIANTGSRIPEDNLTRIFDPFFTTKDPERGTGLGLSICYNIVKDHQGSISVRNNGNFVEFIIDLPIS